MGSAFRILGLGALAVSLGAGPAVTEPPPQRIISDTHEYCTHLHERVSEMMRVALLPPPGEVASLSSEGLRMCDHGQTRGGIMRLRRAMVLMMNWTAGP